MKERDDITARRVDPRQIRSLRCVASIAGQGEVVRIIRPAVLLRDDVLNVMRESGEFLPEQAIFAAASNSLANKFSRGGIYQEEPFNPW
jgi:hypothetical protein